MLEIEWSSDENFNEDLKKIGDVKEARMFHGTIDLLGSSDEEYDSEVGVNDATPLSVNAEEIWTEVRHIVDEMTDFVVRSFGFPELSYDPEGIVAEPEAVKLENACNKLHCGRGCLCSSLRGLFPRGLTHCGKERCMLDCTCLERGLSTADDENHYSDKSKRKKKLPTRFKDVVLGKAYKKLHAKTIYNSIVPEESTSDSEDNEGRLLHSLQSPEKLKMVAPGSKMPSPELKKDGHSVVTSKAAIKRNDGGWAYEKIGPIKKTLQERRIGFVVNTMSDEQTLADVFIWCSLHNKYSCLCINYVFFSKHNSLLWKPSRESRYLANKVMFDIKLKEPTPMTYEVYPFDLDLQCARTVGALLDYRARNKDEVFTTKRKVELEHKVATYSNSYVKFKKFLVIKRPEPPVSAEPRGESNEDCGVPGRLVSIVKTGEKWKVDVGDEEMSPAPTVVVEFDEEVGNSGSVDEAAETKARKTTKMSGRKRKPTMKMMQLEEERRRELLGRDVDMEEPEVDVKRVRKARSSSLTAELGSQERLPLDEEIAQASTKVAGSPERAAAAKVTSEEAIICAPDIGHMFAPREDDDSQHRLVASLGAPPISPPPAESAAALELSSQSDDESVDLEEGDDLDSIHSTNVLILKPRRDGYPHLGLMCLTPGIGYLPVLESLPGRIVLADPEVPTSRRTFDSLNDINVWLNAYMRTRVAFDPTDLTLRWILVKPGVLKSKQILQFDPKLAESSDFVLTADGLSRRSSSECLNRSVSPLALLQNPKFSAPEAPLPKLIPNPKCSKRPLKRASDDDRPIVNSESFPPRSGEFSFDSADGCVTVQRLPIKTLLDRRRKRPAAAPTPPFSWSRAAELDLHHQVTIRPLSALGPNKPPSTLYHVKISK